MDNVTAQDTTPIGDLVPIQEPDLSNPINDPTVTAITDDYSFLQIDERAYKYIRQFSIKNLTDGVVELLTNCNDAYIRGNCPLPHYFMIQYSSKDGSLHVIDNATGLRADKMQMCFLQVGKFTSTETSRGFFSRGAKDVSILGDVYFESIQDGYYSKCVITNNAYGAMLVSDRPVTQEERTRTGIPNNGLHVTIMVIPTYYCTNIPTLVNSIRNRATLRNMMSDPAKKITFQYYDTYGMKDVDVEVRYVYPTGNIILDLTYNVPNYDGVTARWKVYQANSPIAQPNAENELAFGFLVTGSENTVHEVSTLDQRFRWNPYMNMLYGTLNCDYLMELLYDMDRVGVTAANPQVVIDPSRYTGLNRDHPFVQALLSVPLVRLDKMLKDLDASISKSSVQLSDFDEILKEIERYGLQLFSDMPRTIQWNPSYNDQLIKAIEQERLNYAQIERNFSYNAVNPTIDPNYKLESSDWVVMSNSAITAAITAMSQVSDAPKIYALDGGKNIVGIYTTVDINASDFNPSDLQTFYQDLSNSIDPNVFAQHPYIYSLNDQGNLTSLYIFEHGNLGGLTTPEKQSVTDTTKTINISFTRDINQTSRYTIDLSSGIVDIRINLNNPIVSQYLLSNDSSIGTEIDSSEVTIQMSGFANIGNNKSYIFLSELFTDIFSTIIMIGKAQTSSIIVDDGNTYSNVSKVYVQHDQVVTTIEGPINRIFMNYYKQNSIKMINNFSALIAEKITDPTVISDLQDNLLANFTKLF